MKGARALFGILLGLSLNAIAAPVVDLSEANAADAAVIAPAAATVPTAVAEATKNTGTPAVATTEGPAVGAAPLEVPSVDTRNLSEAQRLARLEQQMDNLIRMNLPQQVADLEQQVQKMQGELQVQAHDLKLLNEQQRSFYQDLDLRISKLKPTTSVSNLVDTPSKKTAIETKANELTSEASSTPVGPVATTASSVSATPAVEAAAGAGSEAERYQKAVGLLAQKKYEPAEAILRQYLTDYPKGTFCANAHYWLGEVAFSRNDLKTAQNEFGMVIHDFPLSSKVADAKLKLALVHASSGQFSIAKQELAAIKKLYPGSTAAQLASIQLQQLQDKRTT